MEGKELARCFCSSCLQPFMGFGEMMAGWSRWVGDLLVHPHPQTLYLRTTGWLSLAYINPCPTPRIFSLYRLTITSETRILCKKSNSKFVPFLTYRLALSATNFRAVRRTRGKWVDNFEIRSRYGAVGIATRFGLEGPGIESRWGRDFPHLFRPAPRPTQLLYNGYRIFPGIKAAGAWYWPPTPI